MSSYCGGLLMPAERKSVESMAALGRTAAQHQSLLLLLAKERRALDKLEAIKNEYQVRIQTNANSARRGRVR